MPYSILSLDGSGTWDLIEVRKLQQQNQKLNKN